MAFIQTIKFDTTTNQHVTVNMGKIYQVQIEPDKLEPDVFTGQLIDIRGSQDGYYLDFQLRPGVTRSVHTGTVRYAISKN